MQDGKSRLIEALQALRAILSRGPEEIMPIEPGGRLPLPLSCCGGDRVDEVRSALVAVCRACRVGGKGDHDTSIASENALMAIERMMNMEVGQLDRLPAPRSIIRQLDDFVIDLGGKAPSGAAGRKRRRASDKPTKAAPLTQRQAEVVQVVGECKGNLAESARRLGRDRKTIEDAYRAAMDKLGKTVYRSKDRVGNTTKLHARDRRGQDDVSTDNRRS